MSVKLLFFASLREALACEREDYALPAACSVGEIRAALAARGGEWSRLASPRIRAALNQSLVSEEARVVAGDELAFFPPVTGG